MPIQNYNIYTGDGYVGDIADTGPRVVVSGIVEDDTLAMGVGVKPGTSDEQVTVGSTAGKVYGISLRELNHEADNRPSDGTFSYKKTETASIMREGFVYVMVTGRSVTAHSKLNIVTATGEFTGGAAGAGEVATTNVTAIQSGTVGSVIKARIDVV